MRLRSRIRDEFPRGWWRSAGWWLEGVREIGRGCAVALATALFARQAARLVRDRDDPVALSRSKVTDEAWCAGLLVAMALLGASVGLAMNASSAGMAAAAAALTLWALADLATAATALAVLMRSRIRMRQRWEEIDFVDLNAPRRGRPPETVEEYRALRLQREQEQEG